MRLTPLLALLATPAAAWEFRADPLCTLIHDTPGARVTITRDPALAEPYRIEVTRPAPWPAAPVFELRYDGPRRFAIGTDRHVRSPDGRTLTVTDRGFGNLLDGLEQEGRAVAATGDALLPLDLTGAAGPVGAFRACRDAVPVG